MENRVGCGASSVFCGECKRVSYQSPRAIMPETNRLGARRKWWHAAIGGVRYFDILSEIMSGTLVRPILFQKSNGRHMNSTDAPRLVGGSENGRENLVSFKKANATFWRRNLPLWSPSRLGGPQDVEHFCDSGKIFILGGEGSFALEGEGGGETVDVG